MEPAFCFFLDVICIVLKCIPKCALQNPRDVVGVLMFNIFAFGIGLFSACSYAFCDVRDFGAIGDGRTLDTVAIQRAISSPRCDVVILRAHDNNAVFLSGTLHLRSHMKLVVAPDATLLGVNASVYDLPEPNPFDSYQDFGHSHWHNALVWGAGLVNVTITGGGTLDGAGALGPGCDMPDGYGDKLFSFVSCDAITLRNLSLRRTGHFALLATNVSRLDLLQLDITPTRDGIDLVGCRDVLCVSKIGTIATGNGMHRISCLFLLFSLGHCLGATIQPMMTVHPD